MLLQGFFLLIFTLFTSKQDERLARFIEIPLFMETTHRNLSPKDERVVAIETVLQL